MKFLLKFWQVNYTYFTEIGKLPEIIVKLVKIFFFSTELENFTIPQMCVDHFSKRSWNSGVWTPTRWSHAAGPPTASTETHR